MNSFINTPKKKKIYIHNRAEKCIKGKVIVDIERAFIMITVL